PRHLEAGEHAAEVGAVVTVVEEADVPPPAELVEEFEQGPWPLGELEAVEQLVAHLGRATAHHVADVELRHLVAGEVVGRVAEGAKSHGELQRVMARGGAQADEDVGALAPGEAIVELGHYPRPERRAEFAKGPGALGDGHAEHRLARLAELGALGDEAEAVEGP